MVYFEWIDIWSVVYDTIEEDNFPNYTQCLMLILGLDQGFIPALFILQ